MSSGVDYTLLKPRMESTQVQDVRRYIAIASTAALVALAGATAGGVVLSDQIQGGSFTTQDAENISPGSFQGDLDSCLAREVGQDAAGCVNLVVDAALANNDLYSALGVIRTASARDQRYVALCHDSSHKAGQHAVKGGMSLEQAYAVPFPDCRFGFYHGALTQSTLDLTLEELEQQLDRLCGAFGGGRELKAQECVHATGHLLVDRVGADIRRALQACQLFTHGSLAGRCVDGALMQTMEIVRREDGQAIAAVMWGENAQENYEKVTQLCADLAGQPRYACWNNLPQILAQLWDSDYARIANTCLDVPDDAKPACFEGIAASAFVTYGWDTSRVLRACYSTTGVWVESCVRSMAFTVGVQATSDVIAQACRRVRNEHVHACTEGLKQGSRARAELSRESATEERQEGVRVEAA